MMDPDTLRVLEFPRFLEVLASHARTEMGRRAALQAEVESDLASAHGRLAETREALALLSESALPDLRADKDAVRSVEEARSKGEPMLTRALSDLARFLRAGRDLRAALLEQDGPALRAVARDIPDLSDLIHELELTVDERGSLLDSATPKLREIRLTIGERKERVRQRIERIARRADVRPLLRNSHPTIRDGRYVLAVRAGARGQLKGLYHDRSQSGQTVFLEPEELIDEQNELIDLQQEERKEIRRILWRLTHEAVERLEAIRRTGDSMARFDFACARARMAAELNLTEPSLHSSGPLELAECRHPLLLAMAAQKAGVEDPAARARRAAEAVVPFSIRLGGDFDLIVLTGPNTGGKTVTLKAVGLSALLPRIGSFVPCAPGARVPLYPGVFADVGDEQDLTQSLSTFSGHLRRMSRILREARAGSLVLLDELGSGTDPLEGEALSSALLDHLMDRGYRALVTTHLGRLKEFAGRRARATNASMEFDPDSLMPTYRLLLGIPGASNALRIARNLGLPREIVDAAERDLASAPGTGRELFDELDRARATVERLREEAERDRMEARAERERTARERESFDREKASLMEQAEAAAEQRLRRLAAELEEPRRQLMQLGGPAAHAAGALVEAIRRALSQTPLAEQRRRFARSLEVGDRVLLPRYNEVCRVRRILKKEGRVEVEYRSMSVTVSMDEIAPADPAHLPGGRPGR